MKARSRFSKFAGYIFTLCLVLTSINFTVIKAAEEKDEILYTALGDSIAFGLSATEGNSYVDLFYNYLKEQPEYEGITLNNLGISRDTSTALLEQLSDATVIDSISKSKVITISIGKNNLLQPTIDSIAAAFNLDPLDENFQTKLAYAMALNPNRNAIFEQLQKPEEVPAKLDAGVKQFEDDFSKIIDTIKTSAPNAQINVITIYNPFKQSDQLYKLFDTYIRELNKTINSKSDSCKVIDIYPYFMNNQATLVDFDTLDPHPNDAGHNVIFQAHLGNVSSLDLNIFTDISSHVAKDAINKIAELGITRGYSDGTFKPDNKITRAEFACMFVDLLGLTPKTGKAFNDTSTHWAKVKISTANAYGIINGYANGNFGPNDLITREQMVVMIANALKLTATSTELTYSDKASISSWALKQVAATTQYGLVSAYDGNTFKPSYQVTRADVATAFVKVLEYLSP